MLGTSVNYWLNLQSAYDSFARKIERDPGIVVGRLAKDEKISYTDASVHSLRRKFIISDGYSVNDTIG